MKPLRLFTAFHANLDFSALPDADRPLVIARCYWPLLRLPEEFGIRIGFELSARTLRALQAEDPEWVKRFRGLAERGLIEPIASGWAQIVAPLAPCEINRANLRLGRELYEELLGFVPETYFVPEQTWSDGLVSLYREAGARRIVMEWNNPAACQPALRALRCQPARLVDEQGEGPIVLWNDSIVFQKMQRIAHGQIPPAELETLLARLTARDAAEALCIYGGDVEIFDYRPSRSAPGPSSGGEREIDRLIDRFRALAGDPRFEFVLPREVADESDLLPAVSLGSAIDPIPCKKQPRYNPTRWAVSGRDGFGMNTRCHALLRNERAAQRLAPLGKGGNRAVELLDLWRSDFRTRATEEKIVEFESRIGIATERSRAELERKTPSLADGEDILLVNPDSRAWPAMPIEVPLRLPAGRYLDLEVRTRRGAKLAEEAYQVEVSGRHRDGTIREATLVLEPQIAARSILGLSLLAIDGGPGRATGAEDQSAFETEQVQASFLPHRGGAIASLCFTRLGLEGLIGSVPHGRFDRIEYTPDFFSGHVVAVSETGAKHTDLRPTRLTRSEDASGPVRLTVDSVIESAFGPWRKTYRLYRHASRMDIVHDLAFHDARLASLRLGLFTLLPEGWDRSGLRYETVNGGAGSEVRRIPEGASIAQSRAVSSSVSATSCLGATEGWLSISDSHRRISVQGDRGQSAVAPMLDFEDVDEDFFLRVSHTAAETDETRATFMRGRRRFGFCIEGAGAEDSDVGLRARLRHRGLIYRTEAGVGLSTGL